eukprot:scaffold14947_cov37-Prasinocladus_malaysianus.AAC.1
MAFYRRPRFGLAGLDCECLLHTLQGRSPAAPPMTLTPSHLTPAEAAHPPSRGVVEQPASYWMSRRSLYVLSPPAAVAYQFPFLLYRPSAGARQYARRRHRRRVGCLFFHPQPMNEAVGGGTTDPLMLVLYIYPVAQPLSDVRCLIIDRMIYMAQAQQ